MKNLTGATQLTAMNEGAAALRNDGSVWVWGENVAGHLGNGSDVASSNVPVKASISGVKQIAGGANHMLALKKDGTVWAWGSGDDRQLGQGIDETSRSTPVRVLGLPGGITAVAAAGYASFAVDGLGRVWSWGYNGDGDLGQGFVGEGTGTPGTVAGLSGVTRLAASYATVYAVGSGGVTWSWGRGTDGELGDGSTFDSGFPVQVAGVIAPTSLAGTAYAGFAVRDGRVRTWGYGYDSGIAGRGPSAFTTPTVVPGLTGVTSVAGAYSTGYAVIG